MAFVATGYAGYGSALDAVYSEFCLLLLKKDLAPGTAGGAADAPENAPD
jgi:hypothetical protein